jgi:hypothetical protein
MKKVRAMLAVIAVLAVVGGAFAFKAKNAFTATVYYTTYTTSFKTTANLPFVSTVSPALALFPTSYYFTITNAATTSASSSKTYVTTVSGQ